MHLAVDAGTGKIAAHVLTDGSADDAAQVPSLLRNVEGHIASVTADGAYDRDPTYQAVADRQRQSPPEVIIPPRASAVLSTDDPDAQSPRDRHLRRMAERSATSSTSRSTKAAWPLAGRWRRRCSRP